MVEPYAPIVQACNIAKTLRDPSGELGLRQQKGQAALAALLDVTVTTVNQWYWRKKPVSPKYCVRIEDLTSGAVTRKMLRPNDWHSYWPDLRRPPR